MFFLPCIDRSLGILLSNKSFDFYTYKTIGCGMSKGSKYTEEGKDSVGVVKLYLRFCEV